MLALAITKKLNIVAKISHDRNNQYMITISKNQLELVHSLLKAYMHPSMNYKLGIENSSDSFNYKNISELTQFSSDCIDYNDLDFSDLE